MATDWTTFRGRTDITHCCSDGVDAAQPAFRTRGCTCAVPRAVSARTRSYRQTRLPAVDWVLLANAVRGGFVADVWCGTVRRFREANGRSADWAAGAKPRICAVAKSRHATLANRCLPFPSCLVFDAQLHRFRSPFCALRLDIYRVGYIRQHLYRGCGILPAQTP